MKRFLQSLKKDQRGLTLVELLAVVVILAIVGAIAFVAIGNVIENSKKDAHVANAQQLISAAKLYEASVGEVPTDGLSTTDTEFNTIEDLTNPWENGTYEGTVKKVGEEYQVSITDVEPDCTIKNVPESVINQGREQACEFSGTTSTVE